MSEINWRPTGDRLIVKRVEAKKKTASGVELPESAVPLPSVATVLHVGPGRLDEKGVRHAMEIRIADRVVFAKNAGVEFDEDDKSLLVISERDVMAIDRS